MKVIYALRYFHVVAVVPALFIGGVAGQVAAAPVDLTSNPSYAIDAVPPVVVVQLFAASPRVGGAPTPPLLTLLAAAVAIGADVALACAWIPGMPIPLEGARGADLSGQLVSPRPATAGATCSTAARSSSPRDNRWVSSGRMAA